GRERARRVGVHEAGADRVRHPHRRCIRRERVNTRLRRPQSGRRARAEQGQKDHGTSKKPPTKRGSKVRAAVTHHGSWFAVRVNENTASSAGRATPDKVTSTHR